MFFSRIITNTITVFIYLLACLLSIYSPLEFKFHTNAALVRTLQHSVGTDQYLLYKCNKSKCLQFKWPWAVFQIIFTSCDAIGKSPVETTFSCSRCYPYAQSIGLLGDWIPYSFSKHLSCSCVTFFKIQSFQFYFSSPLHSTFHDAHEGKYISGNEIIIRLFSDTWGIKIDQITWEGEVKGQLKRRTWPPQNKGKLPQGQSWQCSQWSILWFDIFTSFLQGVLWSGTSRDDRVYDLILLLNFIEPHFLLYKKE